MEKTGIVIPAYNSVSTLPEVLRRSLEHVSPANIFVVDDGSTDDSGDAARRFEVNVIRHPANRGKGESLKSGFHTSLNRGMKRVFTIDSDGQHDPRFIPDFIREMEENERDLVIGKRPFRMGGMPLDRIFSNRMSSLLVSWWCGCQIPDSQCGYRLLSRSLLETLNLVTSRFETETEMVIKTAWLGRRIGFCPISLEYSGQGSHINRVGDTGRFCRLLIHLLKKRKEIVSGGESGRDLSS